jgi:hypothetical protein
MMMTGRECALYSSALLLVLYIALCWPRSIIAGRGTIAQHRRGAIAQHRQHRLWEGGWDNWLRDEKDGRAQLLDIDEPINSESCAPNTRRMAGRAPLLDIDEPTSLCDQHVQSSARRQPC